MSVSLYCATANSSLHENGASLWKCSKSFLPHSEAVYKSSPLCVLMGAACYHGLYVKDVKYMRTFKRQIVWGYVSYYRSWTLQELCVGVRIEGFTVQKIVQRGLQALWLLIPSALSVHYCNKIVSTYKCMQCLFFPVIVLEASVDIISHQTTTSLC